MNLIEQIKVNDTSIDGYQGTYYDNIEEYVKLTTDSENKILQGIKSDGTTYIGGDLVVDGSLYTNSFNVDKIVEDIEERIDEILEPAEETLSYFKSIDEPESLEYSFLLLDASNNILESIKTNGEHFIAELKSDIYQKKLISRENIKTINGESILGSGNLEINGSDINGERAAVTMVPPIYPLAVVSFQFDDVPDQDDAIVALFDELGIRCNFAFIASDSNLSNKGKKYLELNHRGYGICSHSIDGNILVVKPGVSNYMQNHEDGVKRIYESKNKLEDFGFTINGWVSPSSQLAPEFIEDIQKCYSYAFTYSNADSTKHIGNPCIQGRQSAEVNLLSQCRNLIRVAYTYGYCLTFYAHAYNLGRRMGYGMIPTYSVDFPYTIGEKVLYNYERYRALVNMEAGEWDASKWKRDYEYDETDFTYDIGDVVLYSGIFYECINITSGSWDANKWRSVPEYSSTENYVVKDLVTHNGTCYRCIDATTGTWDSSKWNFEERYSFDTFDINKLRKLLNYAISLRDKGIIYLGNTDDCMRKFYGANGGKNMLYSGDISNFVPLENFNYHLTNVTNLNIKYDRYQPVNCKIHLVTAVDSVPNITFENGYLFGGNYTFN